MSECQWNKFSRVHIFVSRSGVLRCRWCGMRQDVPLARANDPETSHEAAALMADSDTQRGLKATVMAALRVRDGQTAGEIADAAGEPHERIWRRVSDLKNDGRIRPEGTRQWNGRSQQVWWIVR